ncbi:MAG: geranylgeranyl reductase family protein [Desulfarculaceae bacterium]|nr:geranylgeranyl reductase family protein [Desulfarculaceae bacterium]MCF8072898.1 geranylgeranyl reductase family protein [Desulfarculaceae bacterium]MCF8101066.1 geranylgeranyl reductase family protein [Desulfarculaceae bacterium]MCF8115547.1 geranylgeranyl reductase family protein [Desulfarculaceae bacterium]
MPEQVDVLVVGGGPAGALAARQAALAGAKVLLVDQKARFGALPHCAEYVPRLLATEVEFPPRGKVQAVEGMLSIIGSHERYMPGPGWILDRAVWDHGLVMQAAGAGALAWAGTKLIGREGETWSLKRGGQKVQVRAGAVVAADGAASAVARLAGWERQALMAGVQMQVPLARDMSRTRVYLDPAYKHGYAWLFPKGAAANLGLGCRTEARPLRRLEELRHGLEERGLIRPGVLAMTGGAIPVGGVRPEMAKGRVLLAGDAAGLTHPVSGAGIPQAVFSGIEAGRAAARLAGGQAGAGEDYQHQVLARYGNNLARGLAARQDMEAGWDGEDFAGLMSRVWPGWGGGTDA